MKHKHADLIHAWAEGARIEWEDKDGQWHDIEDEPLWASWIQYRIKPEHKPDIVRYLEMPMFWGYSERRPESNMKVVFDGETGELKSAEVLSRGKE